MILCVGLTPTVQRTLVFDRFSVGAVNRARQTVVTASGKGTNVARVSTTLGGEVRLIQILGGDSGRFIERELDREGVPHHSVWAEDDAPTRTCTTLLVNGGATTELVEEAREVGPHDTTLLFAAIENALLQARAVCLSGSLPPGVATDFYARVARSARALNIPVIIDAQKAPLTLTLAERPFLVKPNVDEALVTLGLKPTGDGETDVQTAVSGLLDAGSEWALVSMGANGSLLGHRTERWRVQSPQVEAVNPIGSGDSLTAGILVGHFVRGLTVPEAVHLGTATAAANCLSLTSGVVSPQAVEQLLPQVQIVQTA